MALLDEEAAETVDGYRVTPFEDDDGWLLRDLISGKEFCLSPVVVAEVAESPTPDHVDREDVQECAQLLRVMERTADLQGKRDRKRTFSAGATTLERVLAPEEADAP